MSDQNHPYGQNQGRVGGPGGPGPYPGAQSGNPPGPQWVPAPSAPSGPQIPSAVQPPSAAHDPAGPAAAQLAPTLRKVGIGNPLPTFVVGALAYIAALLAALLVIASTVLAVLVGGLGDATGGATDPLAPGFPPTGSGGGDTEGLGRSLLALIGMPFQLVALATFGSYDLEMELGFFGSLSASWRGLPLLITVVMAGVGFLGARLAQRRWGSNGPLGAVLWTGISGLAVAIFALIVTRVTALSFTDDEFGMSISMHTAGADMFFGTWALIGLPMLAGHLAGMAKPAWWELVSDLTAGLRLALVHALAYALPVGAFLGLAGAIALIAEGDGQSALTAALLLPVWGLTGLAVLPGLGMLVVPLHLNVRGNAPELGLDSQNSFLWLYDLNWYVWIPIVLFALVLLLAIALLWHRGRVLPTGSIVGAIASWVALPLAYFVGALVLLALVVMNFRFEMGFVGNVAGSIGISAWMPLVAFVIGAGIEVIARFGAPFVDRFVPGVLVNWFRRSEQRRRAAAAQSTEAEGRMAG